MEYVDFISGEIRSYENGVGKIISKEEEYIFNDDDLENGPIVIGDKVYFRPEDRVCRRFDAGNFVHAYMAGREG